jgi:hypothetical protein
MHMSPDVILGIVTVMMALLGAAVSLHPPESLHAPGKWGAKICLRDCLCGLGDYCHCLRNQAIEGSGHCESESE